MPIGRKRAEKWMGKHHKTDIHYDIRLYDTEEFRIKFDLEVPSAIITKLAAWFLKRKGLNANVTMDEFDVDERLYGKVLNGFKKTIKEVEQDTAKDLPGFKIVTMKVKSFKYKEIPNTEKFRVDLWIQGDYVTD